MINAEATQTPFRPDYATPPGDTIADILDERDMTQADLARRLGVSVKHANQVINGAATISPELALGLEKVLGATVAFWLTREALYQGKLAEQQEHLALASAQDWAKKFPIAELKKRNLIPKDARGAGLVAHLLRYLGIAEPGRWSDPTVAYRVARKFESDEFALSAWLRQGEIEAVRLECEPFDADLFTECLQDIRLLTRKAPEEWHPELVRVCAEAGVAVVIVAGLPRTRAHGAARWISPGKALIQLSLRYRWEDIFWFSFFHEAAHVLLHRKKQVFVEPAKRLGREGADPEALRLEDEADRFASRTLIPQQFENRLRRLTVAEIPAFAQQIGVAAAIVVGRLHHEGLLPYNQGNHLRRQLVLSDE
jgi:HTH-type transcriptional regulator/antitoxin HigA